MHSITRSRSCGQLARWFIQRRVALSLTITSVLVTPGSAWAQASPPPAEILRRLAALEAEIAELKALIVAQDVAPTPVRREDPRPREAGQPSETAGDRIFANYLHDLKFGVGIDTYYAYNFNDPLGRVNLFRAYDVTSNNFSLNQASIIAESKPDLEAGRRFGARLDLQYGQATETLQGSLANEPRPWVYRNVFQAFGTYVAPVGSGLTIDFGKWASSLGYESNYTKDQINYSRSYWFNLLPFYHMGARVAYKFGDTTLNYWVTNGTQQTEAFNNFKDQYVGLTLQPSKALSWNINYYLGQEHPDVQAVLLPTEPSLPTQPGLSITPVQPYFRGKLHIFDTYASWQATPTTLVALEGDYVANQNPEPAAPSVVTGGAAYLRRQLTPRTGLGFRGEYLLDRNGLFAGAPQALKEATVTYDVLVNEGFLVRGEWRRDFSNRPVFLTDSLGVLSRSQDTATLGVVWWLGTKRGAW